MHPLSAEVWSMLKNSATLIHFRPRWGVVDAYLQRRQFRKSSNSVKCCENMPRLIINRGTFSTACLQFYDTICEKDVVASIGARCLKMILWPMLKKYRRLFTDVWKLIRSLPAQRENVLRRCLKTWRSKIFLRRRLLHPLLAEIWSMLKNSPTLIASAPCRNVADA